MTCKPRPISGNEPFDAISKDYNRYCGRIVGDADGIFVKLGPEILINGDFSGTWTGDVPQGHLQNGTTTATSFLVKDDINDRLGIVTDGANMGVFQPGKLVQFKTYKYLIDIESVSLGAVKIQLGGDTASFNSAGMSEGFLTSATTDAAAYLSRDGVCDVVINSWSIKEVL